MYVLMNKANGRYYVSSASKKVDHHDPAFAKVFPTLRSAKQANQWFGPGFLDTSDPDPAKWVHEPWDPGIFEVETKVIVKNEVTI